MTETHANQEKCTQKQLSKPRKPVLLLLLLLAGGGVSYAEAATELNEFAERTKFQS